METAMAGYIRAMMNRGYSFQTAAANTLRNHGIDHATRNGRRTMKRIADMLDLIGVAHAMETQDKFAATPAS